MSDPTSIARKRFAVEARLPLVVLGAGPAGVAAAVEAAQLGLEVMLVDEHPLPTGLPGLDIPFTFGARLDASLAHPGRLLERVVAARPGLQAAFDAGVDVRLGVAAWAAFVEGPTSRALPAPLLALSDGARAWLVGFDRLVVAAGARDCGLAFPGWDRPGVMGARGFAAAVDLYGAFAGRRIVVLGGGAAARETVRLARSRGIAVAGVVDVGTAAGFADVPRFPAARVAGVDGAEVAAVRIARLDGSDELSIPCDTIVSAVDVVPVADLFDLLGCALRFEPPRGGWVPVLDGEGRCSRPGIYAAGDCAGLGADPAASGRRAARAAARDASLAAPPPEPLPSPTGDDHDALRRAWLAVHARDGGLPVCQCEEVSLADLLGLRPPHYLDDDTARLGHRDLRSLAADGPLNQDQVKRLTRAGMGVCQGRRCRDQVQTLLAMQGNQATDSVPMPSHRAPLRPLPLAVLAAFDEDPAIRRHWTSWFGIAAQGHPHWEPPPPGAAFVSRWNPGEG